MATIASLMYNNVSLYNLSYMSMPTYVTIVSCAIAIIIYTIVSKML